MTINDLYATAWQDAIKNVAMMINRRLGTNYDLKNDWDALERLATDFDIRFDENGNIVKKEEAR